MAPSSVPASAGVRGSATPGGRASRPRWTSSPPASAGRTRACVGPRRRERPMASTTHDLESSGSFEPPRVQVGPVRLHHMLLDGSWWPRSTDLDTELRDLVPVLDHVRGPVARLLLGVATWTARPHQVVTEGRAVSVGYLAGQSPSMMTVLCADGGTFTMRVAPPGPGAPD